MKAKDIQVGDVLFSADFEASPVKDFYLKADDLMVIGFENNMGFHCHPDRELLVARKGQIL